MLGPLALLIEASLVQGNNGCKDVSDLGVPDRKRVFGGGSLFGLGCFPCLEVHDYLWRGVYVVYPNVRVSIYCVALLDCL